jgi:predicted transposase YbfD/YdcC
LLALLDVVGALVTIDAMGCQREIAAAIRRGEGDYVLAVKQNQPTLFERVEAAIDVASDGDTEDFEEHVTTYKGHGRQEARTDAVMPAPESIDLEGQRQDLKAIRIATSERSDGRGHHSLESRFCILSRVLPAADFAEAARGHWGIENSLHWQLDVCFREDECQVRRDHAPANLGVIRRFVLGLLERETGCRRGIETKWLKCAANDEYCEKALFNS